MQTFELRTLIKKHNIKKLSGKYDSSWSSFVAVAALSVFTPVVPIEGRPLFEPVEN